MNIETAASKEKSCKLFGSAYRLVDNPGFELVFKGYEGVAVAFSLYDKGQQFLTGSVTASQGWPTNHVAIDQFDRGMSSDVTMSFLDDHLRDLGEADAEAAASYIVMPLLTQELYYSDPNHQPKHFPQGSVWKRTRCGR